MGYPDFLCIGARKAGTTWLHENLQKHPQIWLPPVKELHYLDHRPPWLVERLFGRASHLRHARTNLREALLALRRGGSMAELHWAARYCLWPRSDKWYRSLFPSEGNLLTGEVCPGYARIGEEAVASLARRMPRVKLIYFLRDPILCAWSSAGAHFSKKRGARGIDQAAAEDVERYFQKANSVSHLRYEQNLAAWERHYERDQIHLIFFEELESDPREVFRRVLAFLGADHSDAEIPSNIQRRYGTAVGRRTEIPQSYRRFLARLYLDTLVQLDTRLANRYTARWLADARQALADDS